MTPRSCAPDCASIRSPPARAYRRPRSDSRFARVAMQRSLGRRRAPVPIGWCRTRVGWPDDRCRETEASCVRTSPARRVDERIPDVQRCGCRTPRRGGGPRSFRIAAQSTIDWSQRSTVCRDSTRSPPRAAPSRRWGEWVDGREPVEDRSLARLSVWRCRRRPRVEGERHPSVSRTV